jgi:DNA-binding transcriptional LysR family regulator
MGRELAAKLAGKLRLKIFPPPVRLPSSGVHLVWHRNRDKDPGHVWLRKGVEAVFENARERMTA